MSTARLRLLGLISEIELDGLPSESNTYDLRDGPPMIATEQGLECETYVYTVPANHDVETE